MSLVSQENCGQRITLTGRAVNAKLGAELIGAGFRVWIDGLDSWPDGYWSRSRPEGTLVRVSGVLAEAPRAPVFVEEAGELPRAGIPVPAGTDLEAASYEFVLRDASWELIE